MGESLIIIVDQPTTVGDLAASLAGAYEVAEVAPGRFVVEQGEQYLWLDDGRDGGDLESMYTTSERPTAMVALANPRAIGVEYSYSRMAFAREVVANIVGSFDCLIDTDFGLVTEGQTFAAIVRENPDWNWAETPDPRT